MQVAQIFREAQDLLPGGVNSPVRAFKSVGGQPIVFDRVKGAYCWDVDNNKYVDYVGSWGPAIVGHANDEVNAALIAQVAKGTSFGAPCELEVSALSFYLHACMHACRWLVVPSETMDRPPANIRGCTLAATERLG